MLFDSKDPILFPWPAVTSHLQSKYNIIAEINLWSNDGNPYRLYNELKAAYKQEYQPNDRILFYHYDTDFYYSDTSPGFTIYNLVNCLKSLDIPACFCIFITNHYGIGRELNSLIDDDIKMSIFENNYIPCQAPPLAEACNIDVEQVKKAFISLQGIRRPHRVMLLSYLKHYNLFNNGILSWHFSVNPMPHYKNATSDTHGSESCPITLVTVTPFTRINTNKEWDTISKEVFNHHHATFETDWRDPVITSGQYNDSFNISAVKEAFLYVSTETVFDYPYPYLSEKTFRAIVQKRPFVIVGAVGSIAQLKKIGFKTFSNYWDESYDSIKDPNERMRAVVKIIKDISSLSVDQLQDLMYNMKDIIEFNYNFYVNKFSDTILQDRLKSL